ncbi:hypothetical protein IMY05_011G0101300 [Salix suchowensis]|nr:hypothetical protein IMY05_011G0101300 [Salix suchowensis]
MARMLEILLGSHLSTQRWWTFSTSVVKNGYICFRDLYHLFKIGTLKVSGFGFLADAYFSLKINKFEFSQESCKAAFNCSQQSLANLLLCC